MSAGLAADFDLPLDTEMLEWADSVFVMETRHRKVIQSRFAASSRSAPIVVLRIADDYGFMDQALIDILWQRMKPYLPPA